MPLDGANLRWIDDNGNSREITFNDFMTLSPQQRQHFLQNEGQALYPSSGFGSTPGGFAAANLRSVLSKPYSTDPLTPEQMARVVEGMDPAFVQELSQGFPQFLQWQAEKNAKVGDSGLGAISDAIGDVTQPISDFMNSPYAPLALLAPFALTAMGIPAAGAAAGGTAAVSGPELAALIESGTLGAEGAALEAAGLSGGSALYSTATGALEGLGSATGVTPFNPATDYTGQTLQSIFEQVPASGAVTSPVGTTGAPQVTATANGAEPFVSVPGASTGATTTPAVTTMPPATPEVDPTFGGELTQTGAGQFEQLPVGGAGVAAGAGAAASGGSTAAAGGGTALSRILDGTATDADWLSILGTAGSTALGIYGADQQADALRDVAEREDARHREMMAMGAPYRGRLESLYSDPTSYLESSEVTVPVQQGTDALARALSVEGNPFDSGSALHEIQNYATNQLYGRLGQEKDRLAGFGGLTAYNQAAAGGPNLNPTMAGINARGNVLNAAGYGLGQITNPPSTLEQLYRSLV